MQCCGDPFRVGSVVSWTLSRQVAYDFLCQVIGSELTAKITDAEDHHQAIVTDDIATCGTVTSIEAAFCSFAPKPDDPTAGRPILQPVQGTGELEARETADGWEQETERRRFVGYLVTIENDAID
jgi:hypothetical protein